MILTNCAACAAPLAHDAPRCVRCKLRYCDSTCQHDHWRRGHKQMCKKIHRGGNAEQYNADKKYKEAVAVAVEACADDTKGQTCYICLQAVHARTGEGLVRGCACGGRSQVAAAQNYIRGATRFRKRCFNYAQNEGSYAKALYHDDSATLDDLREAVTTLEDIERTARRVLGGAHPFTGNIGGSLRNARAVLRARETPSPG